MRNKSFFNSQRDRNVFMKNYGISQENQENKVYRKFIYQDNYITI